MSLEECADFESDLRAVGLARAFVRQTLTSWEMPQLITDAQVLASELVTNAVLHARTAMRLTLSYDADGLRISVFDENMRLPTMGGVPESATSGRGLMLVERLANTWGVEQDNDGKTVWARIGEGQAKPDEDCVDLTDTDNIEGAIEAMERSESQQPDT